MGSGDESDESVVDLWWADLRSADARLFDLLDRDEMARVERLVTDADRARFALGAVLLRVAVAAATGTPVRSVTVGRTCAECGGPHGAPQVAGVHASVSHAGPLVLVATAPAPVGVDVEAVTRGRHVQRWVIDEARFKTGVDPQAGPVATVSVPTPGPEHLAAVALAGEWTPRTVTHDVRESADALQRVIGSPGQVRARRYRLPSS